MSFSLDIQVQTESGLKSLVDYLEDNDAADLQDCEGFIVPCMDGQPLINYDDIEIEADPLINLITNWLQKMPWIIAGDEECIPLRNSATCFGFEPAGNSVRFYFYEGTEGDVENLYFEPVTVALADFSVAVIDMGNEIIDWADKELSEDEEPQEIGELREIMGEVKQAWLRKKRER